MKINLFKIRMRALSAGVLLIPLLACGASDGTEIPAPQRVEADPACTIVTPPAPRALQEEALARAVADAWIERHAPESMHWDWGPAVLAYGMLDLYEATGDVKYRTYVEKWQAHHAGTFPMVYSDSVAPAASAARLAKWSCDEKLLQTIAQTSAFLVHAPRTAAGGIGHLGLLQPYEPQLWVDSLFMFGSFLMHRGELFTTPQDWDVYAEQILIFADELQDPVDGLFRHALVKEEPWPASAVYWGRGNGWVASILGRFLVMLPKEHPSWEAIAEIERKLLTAVLETQDESALWWTVVNSPGWGYTETSASALFADALLRGAKLGLVDAAVAETAFTSARAAVMDRIVEVDGLATVQGTSGPTQPGGLEYYAGLPVGDDIHYGVGAVLLMLTAR
jgi:unsaturated rhamnogalacturonyl hydrolase